MRYVLSYDLNNNPLRDDYEALWAELRKFGFVPIQYSQWAVRWDGTNAKAILQIFLPFIDGNDSLLVANVDAAPDWWSYNLKTDLTRL